MFQMVLGHAFWHVRNDLRSEPEKTIIGRGD